MKHKRLLAIVFALTLVAVGVLLMPRYFRHIRLAACQAEFRRAVAQVETLSAGEVGAIETVKALKCKHAITLPSDGPSDWLSDNLILMANGEWIVYSAECGAADWRKCDIFVGKASDGKWYYTTYHFCGMINLLFQPPNLTSFIRHYALGEFDGNPESHPPATWPRRHSFQATGRQGGRGASAAFRDRNGTKFLVLLEGSVHGSEMDDDGSGNFQTTGSELHFEICENEEAVMVDGQHYALTNGGFFHVINQGGRFIVRQRSLDDAIARELLQ